MKKSNVIILGILVIASIFFLWLWYYLQFNLIDNPLDLILTIIWWVVVALAIVAIRKVEKTRQERVRTTYLSKTDLFNSEAGVVEIGAGASPVEAIEGMLAELKYNFDMQDLPEDAQTKFDYVVRSKEFEFEKQDNDSADSKIEVTKWEGEVVSVAHPDDDPQKFESREDLVAILEGAKASASAAVVPPLNAAPATA